MRKSHEGKKSMKSDKTECESGKRMRECESTEQSEGIIDIEASHEEKMSYEQEARLGRNAKKGELF